MRRVRYANPLPNEPRASKEARRAGRLRADGDRCELGRIVDVSSAGIRVRGKGTVSVDQGDCIPLTLELLTGTARLVGRVAWVRRRGLLSHEIGVEFIDVPDDARAILASFARSAALTPDFHDDHRGVA